MKRTILVAACTLIAGAAFAWPLYLRPGVTWVPGETSATLAAPTDAQVEIIGVETWSIEPAETNITVSVLRDYAPTATNALVVLDGTATGNAASNLTGRTFLESGDVLLFTGPTNAAVRVQFLRFR